MIRTTRGILTIAACADATYAPYLGVMLASLLLNTANPENYSIFVVDGGMGPIWTGRLKELGSGYGATVEILRPQETLPTTLPTFGYLKAATYLRLTLPAILPLEIHKVLYLDCDVIVRRDIKDLFEVDLEGFAFGAVPDLAIETLFFGRKLKRRLGMSWDAVYFNAGVLLLDLDEIRRTGLFSRALQFLIQNPEKIRCADQDGLNALANGRFKPLADAWNVQSFGFRTGRFGKRNREEDFAIVHFCDEEKPWDEGAIHPFHREFYRYAATCHWFLAMRPKPRLSLRLTNSARTLLISIGLRRWLYRMREAYKYEASEVLGRYHYHKFFKYAFYFMYYPGRWLFDGLNQIYGLAASRAEHRHTYMAKFVRATIRWIVPNGILTLWNRQILDEKQRCACCRNMTIRVDGSLEPRICPVCSWEVDSNLKNCEVSMSNGVSLVQAHESFRVRGSYHERFLSGVRAAASWEKQSISQQSFSDSRN